MARGRSTAARTQAREAARTRKAAADAERRERDQIEEDASVEFELARGERDAAEQRAAEQVRRLDELPGMRTDRIAALLGDSSGEIKRLRKLSASEAGQSNNDEPEPDTSSPTSTEDTAGADDIEARASTEGRNESEDGPAGGQLPSSCGAAD